MNFNLVRGVLIFSGAMPIAPTLTPTPTFTPSVTPTFTPTPTLTPTPTPTVTPSFTPTFTPSVSAVSVSAYDFGTFDVNIDVIETIVNTDYDYSVVVIGAQGVELKGSTTDVVREENKLVGVGSNDGRDAIVKSEQTIETIDMNSSTFDPLKQNTQIEGVELSNNHTDTVKNVNTLDGVEMNSSTFDPVSQTLDISGEHTNDIDPPIVKQTEQLETIDMAPSINTDHVDELNQLESISTLQTVNKSRNVEVIETLVEASSELQKGVITNTFDNGEMKISPRSEPVSVSTSLNGVETREIKNHNLQSVNVDDIENVIDADRSKHVSIDTEISGVSIEHGRVERSAENIQVLGVEEKQDEKSPVTSDSRITGINHTDDLSSFRVNEKIHADSRITGIDNQLADDKGHTSEVLVLETIDHKETTEFPSVSATITIENGSYDLSTNTDGTRVIESIESVTHVSSDVFQTMFNTALSAVTYLEEDAQKVNDIIALSGIDHIFSSERVDTLHQLIGIESLQQKDIASIFGDMTQLIHSAGDNGVIGMNENMTGVEIVFDQGRKVSFSLDVENITHIFGDEHSIGVVMGISDGNSTTYAAHPTIFDMSLIGVSHSYEDEQKTSATVKLSSALHISNPAFKVGATLVLENAIHSINTDGAINSTVGVVNTTHSKSETSSAFSTIGLYYIEHLRDFCFFDNTDTYFWDNDVITWDNDPPHP